MCKLPHQRTTTLYIAILECRGLLGFDNAICKCQTVSKRTHIVMVLAIADSSAFDTCLPSILHSCFNPFMCGSGTLVSSAQHDANNLLPVPLQATSLAQATLNCSRDENRFS